MADPTALGLRNTQSLPLDWLAPDRLAKLAALQQLLPWQPSAVDAVQQFAAYVAMAGPSRLMGRLLFLQQEGVLPLVVAERRAAQQQWRQQRSLPASSGAQGVPQLFSLRDIAILSDAKFCALLEQAEAAQPEQPVSGSGSGSNGGGGVVGRYEAFVAQLPQLPAYQQLLAAGAAESRRLAELLPPELAAGNKGQQQHGREI